MLQLVRFTLDGQDFAVPLTQVLRVLPAVEVTPLPELPAPACGVIDLAGELLAVVDVRQPPRLLCVDDQFLVLSTARRPIVLVVDQTHGVVERTSAAVASLPAFGLSAAPFAGAVRCEDGLVLLHDAERFLSDHLARALEDAEGARS